jgi:hypothetical protein
MTEPLAVVKAYSSVYKDLLSPADMKRLQRYISGLMVSPNKTVEGINKLFVLDAEDQSSLNRFLTANRFDVSKLNAARVGWLQDCSQTAFKGSEGEKGVLILDDTLLSHYGANFEKAAWLYDHTSKSYAWSHNLVNLHYSDDGTDYPVDFRLWEPADPEAVEKAMRSVGFEFRADKLLLKTERPSEWRSYLLRAYRRKRLQKSGKSMEAACRTKIDEARQMLKDFFSQYPGQQLPVAFDHWYTCSELCKFIDEELKRPYVGTLEEGTILAIGPQKTEMTCKAFIQQLIEQHGSAIANGKKPLFEKVGIHYKGQKETYWAYCQTHNVKVLGRQRLVISFSKEDLSDSEPKIYVSNRLHWRSGGILRIRRHRWPIEVYHEEAKAEGLDRYQVRQFDALKKHIACVCVAYSMLKRVQFDPELLNKLTWNPTEKQGSLAFWRRVMTANALLGFVGWVIQDLPDKPLYGDLLQKLARVYS